MTLVMARRRCRRGRRGGLLPSPIPPPFTIGQRPWRNPYRMIGRGVKIENLKNYRLGYRYSPQLKRWVSPKTGQGIYLSKKLQRLYNRKRGIIVN